MQGTSGELACAPSWGGLHLPEGHCPARYVLECPTLPTFDLFLKVIALQGADFCRGVTMIPFCTLIFTLISPIAEVGIVKDATFIAAQQEQMALEAAGGGASKVLGSLMDGPAANRKAGRILEDEYQT